MKLTWLYKGVWVWTLYSKRVEAEVSDRKWGKSLWKLVLPFVLFVFVFVLLILFCTSKGFTLPEPFFCLLDFGVLERTLSLKKKKTKPLFATRELLHWRERERCVAILLFAPTALFCFCLMFFGVPPHNPSISFPQRLQCHDIPAI